MAATPDKLPLIVIVGETGSGKSALAMYLAERFDGEIISADSWTVYRGFDIGTAKPTTDERQRVPHHLLDIANPREGFSAAEYKRLAQAAIDEITNRNKLPILVGGTGLYVDSVIFNYSFLPPVTPERRAELNAHSLDELLDQVSVVGLDILGIDLRNKRRIIRLLETNGARPEHEPFRPQTFIIGLGITREELRTRVETRTDAMLQAGLEDEVRRLANQFGWHVEPMKGIGYREFYDYFEGDQSLEQTRERIISDTMNLAKRQRAWFKRNNRIRWVHEQVEAVDLVTTFLNK